ncbi:MAG: hypothetical protein R3189_09690 [Thiomicrorhabdus chilensis]|uniref:hypothetical protein n=1 Tax=Thiomicrorhabdus chilensis TaxID=63656 RepID=UPI00299EBA6D|nr:hypothetical protein [Thiomicrorhabdus chilensis]MDX1348504.1 hypothetical protein [Thiomicrorhabdus chilensis]
MFGFHFKNSLIAVTLVGVISLLSGCNSNPPKSMMNVQPGERFHLKQAIAIPAGKARQFIQFGQITGSGFDRREQHCRIEIYELQTSRTVIQPESFRIERVQLGEEQIAQLNQPIQMAANFNTQTSDLPEYNPVLALSYERPETMDLVHLYLKSKQQPNVYRLTCAGALSDGSMADAPRSFRPQRTEINRILGTVGKIEK